MTAFPKFPFLLALCCAFLFGEVFCSSQAWSDPKFLAIPIVGKSLSGDGIEYEGSSIQMNCMKQKGWDIEPITSSESNAQNFNDNVTTAVKPADSAAVRSNASGLSTSSGAVFPQANQTPSIFPQSSANHVHSVQNPPGDDNPVAAANDQQLGQKTEDQVLQLLKKMTGSLQSGDQLFVQVDAHGESNCDRAQGVSDVASTLPNFDACDNEFSIGLPNGTAATIKTKDLVPLLRDLQSKGVKVAVDIKDCFGGAAIKDFANAGICAQAYTTPSSVTVSCGGDANHTPSPAEKTYLYNTTIAFTCAGLANPMQGLHVDGQSRAESPQCLEGAMDTLSKTIDPKTQLPLASDASLADEYRDLRAADMSASQPIGSNQPFWMIGNLGLLGREAAEQGESPCNNLSSSDFIKKLSADIGQLGLRSKYAPGCPPSQLQKEVASFFQDPNRKKIMDEYLKRLREFQVNDHAETVVLNQFVDKNGGAAGAGPAMTRLAEQLASLNPNPMAQQSIARDPAGFVRLQLLQAAGYTDPAKDPQGFQKLNELMKKRNQALLKYKKIFDDNGINIEAVADQENALGNKSKKDQMSLQKYIAEKISPLERQLVNQISDNKSPDGYWICAQKNNPALAQAKAACEAFKMNPPAK